MDPGYQPGEAKRSSLGMKQTPVEPVGTRSPTATPPGRRWVQKGRVRNLTNYGGARSSRSRKGSMVCCTSSDMSWNPQDRAIRRRSVGRKGPRRSECKVVSVEFRNAAGSPLGLKQARRRSVGKPISRNRYQTRDNLVKRQGDEDHQPLASLSVLEDGLRGACCIFLGARGP